MRKILLGLLVLTVACFGCEKVDKAITNQQEKTEKNMDDQVQKGVEKIKLPAQAGQQEEK